MGIYIKSIKKPWRCDECMFTNSADECIFLKTDADIDGLNIDCPIVEIADRKTENSSEKPNNCETWQDWKDRMWAEAIVTEPQTKVKEKCDRPQMDIGTGCSRCGVRFGCIDRDMPHAVHCNSYGKITDEPTERSE